jgi:hypothetical protein
MVMLVIYLMIAIVEVKLSPKHQVVDSGDAGGSEEGKIRSGSQCAKTDGGRPVRGESGD